MSELTLKEKIINYRLQLANRLLINKKERHFISLLIPILYFRRRAINFKIEKEFNAHFNSPGTIQNQRLVNEFLKDGAIRAIILGGVVFTSLLLFSAYYSDKNTLQEYQDIDLNELKKAEMISDEYLKEAQNISKNKSSLIALGDIENNEEDNIVVVDKQKVIESTLKSRDNLIEYINKKP
jgi:hypothetical protein